MTRMLGLCGGLALALSLMAGAAAAHPDSVDQCMLRRGSPPKEPGPYETWIGWQQTRANCEHDVNFHREYHAEEDRIRAVEKSFVCYKTWRMEGVGVLVDRSTAKALLMHADLFCTKTRY